MSGLLARLASTFVAPPTASRVEAVSVVPPPPAPATAPATAEDPPQEARAMAVGVLARAPDAWAAGGALALGLLARTGASTAVVCVWAGGPGPCALAPATPAARRLAGRLAERGHDARATGRLVLATLDGEAAVACTEAARVAAVAGIEPVVTVLAGARDAPVDLLLGGQDRVVVVGSGPGDGVADLAAASVAVTGVAVRLLALVPAAPARALATTGVALVAPLRAAVEAALR